MEFTRFLSLLMLIIKSEYDTFISAANFLDRGDLFIKLRIAFPQFLGIFFVSFLTDLFNSTSDIGLSPNNSIMSSGSFFTSHKLLLFDFYSAPLLPLPLFVFWLMAGSDSFSINCLLRMSWSVSFRESSSRRTNSASKLKLLLDGRPCFGMQKLLYIIGNMIIGIFECIRLIFNQSLLSTEWEYWHQVVKKELQINFTKSSAGLWHFLASNNLIFLLDNCSSLLLAVIPSPKFSEYPLQPLKKNNLVCVQTLFLFQFSLSSLFFLQCIFWFEETLENIPTPYLSSHRKQQKSTSIPVFNDSFPSKYDLQNLLQVNYLLLYFQSLFHQQISIVIISSIVPLYSQFFLHTKYSHDIPLLREMRKLNTPIPNCFILKSVNISHWTPCQLQLVCFNVNANDVDFLKEVRETQATQMHQIQDLLAF